MTAVALAGGKLFEKLNASLPLGITDAVVADEQGVRRSLNEKAVRGNASPDYFLPMPPLPARSKLCTAFYRPTFRLEGRECDIEVVVIGPGIKNSFGLRFERGVEGANDTHGYCHVQLTRAFNRKRITCSTALPISMPESYPALPTRARSSGDTWIAVLASLFGFGESEKVGLKDLIERQDLGQYCIRDTQAFEKLISRADDTLLGE